MSIACFLAEGDGTGRTLVAVNLCMPQEKGRFVDHSPVKQLSYHLLVEALTRPRALFLSVRKITAVPLLRRKTFMTGSLA